MAENEPRLPVVHLGGMRCASTFLQQIAKQQPGLEARVKSRIFSYDPYFEQAKENGLQPSNQVIFDSDENYALGRFKSALISYKDLDFNFKKELSLITHDQVKMRDRIKSVYPEAKILLIIRQQASWIKSVYKHDIEHFGVHASFKEFLESDLGKSYTEAGDFHHLYELYVAAYGEHNIKVVLFESIRRDETKLMKEIGDFIGVDLEVVSRATNESLPDSFLVAYRLINRFSQSNPSKKEHRTYYLMRRLLLSRKHSIGKLLHKQDLVSDQELMDFHHQYKASNRSLGAQIGLASEMEQLGYF